MFNQDLSNNSSSPSKYDIEVKVIGLLENKINSIGETRRFRFVGSNFQELNQQINSLFNFPNSRLQWLDEDNDLISFSSDQELEFLIKKVSNSTNLLKIYIPIVPVSSFSSPPTTSVSTNLVAPPLPNSNFVNNPASATTTVQTQVQYPVLEVNNVNNNNNNNPVSSSSSNPSVSSDLNLANLKERRQALKKMIQENRQNWRDVKKIIKEEQHKIKSETRELRKELKEKRHERKLARLSQASISSSNPSNSTPDSISKEKCGKKKSKEIAARFVQHVGIQNLAQISPGSNFTKIFRFRNEGTKSWPSTTELVFISRLGDRLGGPDSVKIGKEVAPGEEIDISIPLQAPIAPGKYVGFWRLRSSSDGFKFGQRVDVSILVSDSPSTTTTSSSPTTTSSSSSSDSSSSSSSDDSDSSSDEEIKEVKKNNSNSNDSAVDDLLEKLKSLGFKDKKGLKDKLVNRFNGDMNLVIAKLSKKAEKFAKRAEKKARKAIRKAEKKQKKESHKSRKEEKKKSRQENQQRTSSPSISSNQTSQ